MLNIRNIIDISVELYQWFIRFFKKNTSDEAIKNENMSNKELAEKLHKPIINKIQEKNTPIF